MSGVNGFEGYLLANERWLTTDGEDAGTHEENNTLEDGEISTFFSNTHLEVDSFESGDAKISSDEFDNWFNANTSAITSYWGDNVSKDDVKSAMLDFINQHSDVFATTHDTNLGNLDVSELQEQPTDPGDTKPVISNADAQLYADQLYSATAGRWGTDDEQVSAIMNNSNLTNSDWLKIMNTYNNSYGSLVVDIDNDFSGSTKKQYLEKLSGILLDEMENESSDALRLLCREFYNGTAGQLGTADEFVAHIMNNASNNVLGKLVRRYGAYNGGRDIFDDIKGDFSGSLEDRYIAKLNEALSTTDDNFGGGRRGGSFGGGRTHGGGTGRRS